MKFTILGNTGAESEFRLDRWKWRFVNAQHERSYRLWRVQESLPYFRITAIAAFGGWLLGIAGVYLFLPQTFVHLSVAFFFLAAPLIVTTYTLTLTTAWLHLVTPVGALTNGAAGLAAVWVIETGFNVAGASSALMAIVSFFSFVMIRLPPVSAVMSVLPGITYVCWTLMEGSWSARMQQDEVFFFSFILAMSFLTGLLACYLLEVQMRLGFRDRRVIDMQQQALVEERTQLSKFLAPEVARLVREGDAESAFARKSVVLTVLYCDLRGFTQYTEHCGAEKMSSVLAEYYSGVIELARKYEATVNNFIGDGIMLLIGAPIERNDHRRAGLNLAQEIMAAVRLILVPHQVASVPLGVGIGLASGPCAVGAIGSQSRIEYTAIGSAVNLAARFCACAEDGEIVMQAEIARAASSTGRRAERALSLKGFSEPVVAIVETGTGGSVDNHEVQPFVTADI